MTQVADARTRAAFDRFREMSPLKPVPPSRINHSDECTQLTPVGGLLTLRDGPVEAGKPTPAELPPLIDDARSNDICLWVVSSESVPYALEQCDFARNAIGLEQNKIKHSNLTGGGPAHCGGEILFLDDRTVAITGRSGRFGPKSAEEMEAVSKAFCRSGYHVLSMGWDAGVAQPMPFIGVQPSWVICDE